MTAPSDVPVHPTNEAAARAWDGHDGGYWATHADRFDRSVAGYHPTLMQAAAPEPDARCLDVGCGTGQVTRDCATAASAGTALGVDLSSAMLELARSLATRQGIGNAHFEHGDAQVYPFEPGGFDLVVSRMGTMFFGDREAAFANLAGAMRPGARLATLVWQGLEHNEWISQFRAAMAAGRDLPTPPPGAPGPFAFADPDESRRVLAGAGFVDIEIDPVSAPLWWGDDPQDAHGFAVGILGWMLDGLDDDGVRRANDNLRDCLQAHATPDGVMLESACWLVRARRGGT